MNEIIKNGESIIYENETMTDLECCDCGLVHTIFVTVKGKKASIKFFRNDYETSIIRKSEKIRVMKENVCIN
ncbi:hypothetical protein LCGC14_1227980 [marine sediment metagenome]|uniref:Uncharacterized protein n=1 Tax=marine sediment metagenome TaxID=412755 RepID=A0A0F9L9D4_9ZZZZ